MTNDEARVAELIRDAFDGVRLGRGVGLREAQAIDDYADGRTRLEYRNADEKQDWSAIPVEELSRCYSSLSFFDPEGMRFHLPAFLLADLDPRNSDAPFSVLFHLTYPDAESYFSALSDAQRAAVREFLRLRLADPRFAFEHDLIRASLDGYWRGA